MDVGVDRGYSSHHTYTDVIHAAVLKYRQELVNTDISEVILDEIVR